MGAAVRGDELPTELRRREDRLAAIRAAKARLEAAQRAGGSRAEGQNPQGGRPYKRGYGEPDENPGAEQLHGSGQRDHEDEHRRVPAVLQRRRWRWTLTTSWWWRPT